MRQTEAVIRKGAAFFRSDTGKAAIGLFGGVFSFCFPQVPGFAVGAVALYYCIHQFRPVAAWIYDDIREDMSDTPEVGEQP